MRLYTPIMSSVLKCTPPSEPGNNLVAYLLGCTAIYTLSMLGRQGLIDEAWYGAAFGEYGRHMRHHMGSTAGAGSLSAIGCLLFSSAASLAKSASQTVGRFNRLASSTSENAAGIAAVVSGTVLTTWELLQSTLPRRSFDWIDLACGAGAIAASYVVCSRDNRPNGPSL